MKLLIGLFVGVLVSFGAHADLKASFKKLDLNRKGPFSVNYLQGSRSRINVLEGSPAGTFQFQAAFRNDQGQELATKYDFYVANLFTTNYYELMGEYVYNDIYGSHELDHAALLAVAPRAQAKAASMVRHWVLEKHYVNNFPSSRIAQVFKLRGIGGSEFEQAYAPYFFNFYMTTLTEDFQFLPVYLLAKSSPIAASSSLERARVVIAQEYDQMLAQYGEAEPVVNRMYQLRNAVHNQLSQEVVNQIDAFFRDFPWYRQQGNVGLTEVQDIVRAYYAVNVRKIADYAKKIGADEIQALAEMMAKTGPTPDSIYSLSTMIAKLRTAVATNDVPASKKSDVLLVIITANQYLNKEILSLPQINSKNVIKAIINLVYVEGFLIKDNWTYFLSEIDATPDAVAAAALFPDIVEIANDTLAQAFNPSFTQWLSIEPKMQYFVDNTIKSSALNTASVIGKKVKK
jgi:hypothetical protein